MHRRSKRAGTTLVEVALALSLVSVVIAGFILMMGNYSERNRALDAAGRLTQVATAAQAYLKANANALSDKVTTAPLVISVARTVPGGAVPTGPSADLPSLQAGGFLPSAFVDSNGYGQSHAMIVRKVGTTGRLEAIVTTMGGRIIPDTQLGEIAEAVGSEGGFVPSVPTPGAVAVTGTGGAWGAPVTPWTNGGTGPTAGHVVASMALDEGSLVTDYLYRRDIGVPAANTMMTNLSMGGNSIVDVAQVANLDTKLVLNAGGAVTTSTNTGLDVTGTLTAKRDAIAQGPAFTDGDVSASKFVDADDPAYFVDPSSKSRFFDLKADKIDTASRAYGDTMTNFPGGSSTTSSASNKSLGSYLRHDIRIVKTIGPQAGEPSTPSSSNPVFATAYCPSGYTRISCSGSRTPNLTDNCSEGNCGFVGAVAIEDPTRGQGCQTVIDMGEVTNPVAIAYCMSHIEGGGGAGAPSNPGTGGDEPIVPSCPAPFTSGTYPNCSLPVEKTCPVFAPGAFPTCIFPAPTPTCPDWAPGVYPNCVVTKCPTWAPGVYPLCRIQEPDAPDPISMPVRALDATAYCPSGYRVQSCKPDSSATTGHYGRFVGYFYSETGDNLYESAGTYSPAPYTVRQSFNFGTEAMSNALIQRYQGGNPLFTAVVYAGGTGKGRCTSYNGYTPVQSLKILTCVRDQ